MKTDNIKAPIYMIDNVKTFLEEVNLHISYQPITLVYLSNKKKKDKVRNTDEVKLRDDLKELGFLNVQRIEYGYKKRDGVYFQYPRNIFVTLDTMDYGGENLPITQEEVNLTEQQKKLLKLHSLISITKSIFK